MSKFFVADEHYDHENIIKGCGRPYKNTQEMNKDEIERHNSVVTKEDEVYHLGDIWWGNTENWRRFAKIFNQLNGKHHLILGNHDNLKPFAYVEIGFLSVHTSLKMGSVHLIHDPSASCIDRNNLWLCGHVHDLFVKQKNVINVGVDVWDFTPVSMNQILNLTN